MIGYRSLLVLTTLALVVVSQLGFAATATAQGTLNGESLYAEETGAPLDPGLPPEVVGQGEITATCDPEAGTVSYTVTGVALGPYPGTFEETGTATYDPT